MALPLQKQVHKVDLTLAGNLGGLIDAGVPIGVHHGGLLDLKQAMLHGALRGKDREQAKEKQIDRLYDLLAIGVAIASMIISLVK